MRNLWKWALGFLGVILVTFFISTLFFRGSGLPGFGCGGFGLMGRGIGWGSGMLGALGCAERLWNAPHAADPTGFHRTACCWRGCTGPQPQCIKSNDAHQSSLLQL